LEKEKKRREKIIVQIKTIFNNLNNFFLEKLIEKAHFLFDNVSLNYRNWNMKVIF